MTAAASSRAAADRVRADHLAAAGGLGEREARVIADALVRRHAAAPRAPWAFPPAQELAEATAGSIARLRERAPARTGAALDELARRQARFFETHADRFLARAGAGRVLQHAVALRLEDVALRGGDRASIRSLRGGAAGDLCVELAGLAVDLRAADLPARAERLLSHYAGEADDFDLYDVVDAFECRCALERADECARAAAHPSAHERRGDLLARVSRLLAQAVATRRQTALPPVVVALGGQVASGKSSMARALAVDLAAPRIVGDRVRRLMVEGAPGHELHEARTWQSLAPGFHESVYAAVLERAERVLASGRPRGARRLLPARTRPRRGARPGPPPRRGLPLRRVPRGRRHPGATPGRARRRHAGQRLGGDRPGLRRGLGGRRRAARCRARGSRHGRTAGAQRRHPARAPAGLARRGGELRWRA